MVSVDNEFQAICVFTLFPKEDSATSQQSKHIAEKIFTAALLWKMRHVNQHSEQTSEDGK